MSDRRRFLKGLTSIPLATVLANPRLAAAVSAGLQEVEAKLADGRTVKGALAEPQGQAKGSILSWIGRLDRQSVSRTQLRIAARLTIRDAQVVQPIEKGRVVELKRVGGLHHLYARMAA